MIVVALAMSVFSGYVFSDMWGMFIVPLGVMAIGVWHAMGISLTVSLIRLKVDPGEPVSWEAIVRAVLNVLIFWGMGNLIHWIMISQ